jgi:DNA-binding LacI/PurR family transcriptional regulator
MQALDINVLLTIWVRPNLLAFRTADPARHQQPVLPLDYGTGSMFVIVNGWLPQRPKEGFPVSGLDDVARQAGVSKSTASRALSGQGYVSAGTRERVIGAAAELGFVASTNAASLVTGRTRNVGVLTPFINRWFFAEVLEGIESALIGAGYDLTIYRLSSDAEERRRVFDYFLMRKRVDAVITVSIALTPREVEILHSRDNPIMCIGGEVAGISSLSIDDTEASRKATEHLLSLGHTRIMHFGGDLDEQLDFRVHTQRLHGFRAAMAEAGIEPGDDFRTTAFSIPAGFEVGLAVLADPTTRPTAIYAACDEIAIGVIIAARQLGIAVPQQLSIVGVDDHPLAAMFGLTTLRQEPAQQGALAVEVVMNELHQLAPPEGRQIRIPVHLVVRGSTTAPPA